MNLRYFGTYGTGIKDSVFPYRAYCEALVEDLLSYTITPIKTKRVSKILLCPIVLQGEHAVSPDRFEKLAMSLGKVEIFDGIAFYYFLFDYDEYINLEGNSRCQKYLDYFQEAITVIAKKEGFSIDSFIQAKLTIQTNLFTFIRSLETIRIGINEKLVVEQKVNYKSNNISLRKIVNEIEVSDSIVTDLSDFYYLNPKNIKTTTKDNLLVITHSMDGIILQEWTYVL